MCVPQRETHGMKVGGYLRVALVRGKKTPRNGSASGGRK
jgi:hypothetical protein